MALPEMTPEQRAEALRKAAESRAARTAAMNRLRSGEVSILEVLEGKLEPLLKVKAGPLLRAVPGIGKVRAANLLEELGIDEKRRISGLGAKQRAALVSHFAAEAATS